MQGHMMPTATFVYIFETDIITIQHIPALKLLFEITEQCKCGYTIKSTVRHLQVYRATFIKLYILIYLVSFCIWSTFYMCNSTYIHKLYCGWDSNTIIHLHNGYQHVHHINLCRISFDMFVVNLYWISLVNAGFS